MSSSLYFQGRKGKQAPIPPSSQMFLSSKKMEFYESKIKTLSG
jgi:hypothetical protein